MTHIRIYLQAHGSALLLLFTASGGQKNKYFIIGPAYEKYPPVCGKLYLCFIL